MELDIYKEISQRELIEKMDSMEGDVQVVTVKSAEPNITPNDVRNSVVSYIGRHSYVGEEEKAEEENFIDFNSFVLEKGPEGSVYIIIPKDENAKRIVTDMEKEYPDDFLYEIADRDGIEKGLANNPLEAPLPEVMSPE